MADPNHPKSRREVLAGTLGVEKATEETSVFYVVWKEGRRIKKEATRLTDERAANAYLGQWEKARERGQIGLIDTQEKRPRQVSLADYLAEYLGAIKARSPAYLREIERELTTMFAATNAILLRDLTADKVTAYLGSKTASASARAKYRAYLSGFTKWFFRTDKTPTNICDRVPVPQAGQDEPIQRARRPYSEDELRRLFRSARDFPIQSRGVNKGGRPRLDGTPARAKNPVQLRDGSKKHGSP